MTAFCASLYRNPLNDSVGKKHFHQNRFRPRQSTRSAFYKPGLSVIESHNHRGGPELSKPPPPPPPQDSREPARPEGHWGFRPSALQHEGYGRGEMSVREIVDWYVRDNERAEEESVAVPPRPSLSARHPKRKLGEVRDALFSASSSSLLSPKAGASSSSSVLRCLQWNIQAFSSPKDERNMHTITAGIIRSICESDSDVLVLNEIHWREETSPSSSDGAYYHCESTKQAIRTSQALLEEILRLRGYHYSRVARHGDTPTMIATRKKVLVSKEVVLSDNRSALCLLLETGAGSSCWVVGTHLDAFCAERRRSEIKTLLNEARQQHHHHHHQQQKGIGEQTEKKNHESEASVPVLIAGDFNQQRCRDYTPSEWQRVAASADLRGVPRDDGVAGILERGGFRCVLDDVRSASIIGDNEAESSSPPRLDGASSAPVACNWNQAHPPPSTHWSGTTIDYTYYYNHGHSNTGEESQTAAAATPTAAPSATTRIAPHGVYVGPAGFSDHRMTVTDWILTTTTTAAPRASPQGPRPNHIDKSFFFHHLPEGRHHSWLYNKQSSPVPRKRHRPSAAA